MKRFFTIIPASCGVVGVNTVYNETTSPFLLERLHVLLQFNTNEPLLRVGGGIWLIAARAASTLCSIGATGFTLHEAEIELDPQMALLGVGSGLAVGVFQWLKVHGRAACDDFGEWRHRLIVSGRSLEVLMENGLAEGKVTELLERP